MTYRPESFANWMAYSPTEVAPPAMRMAYLYLTRGMRRGGAGGGSCSERLGKFKHVVQRPESGEGRHAQLRRVLERPCVWDVDDKVRVRDQILGKGPVVPNA
jgi:hypothetical protein